MTDRELLELASKAAGLSCSLKWWEDGFIWVGRSVYAIRRWNPLTDDGDALRLAVKLRMVTHFDMQKPNLYKKPVDEFVNVVTQDAVVGSAESCAADPYAATRRAIVRAAAEIGKGM